MSGATDQRLAGDPILAPFASALDRAEARRALARLLGDGVRVERTQLVRHVAGRRAVVRYDLRSPTGPRSVAAKIRAKGTDRRTPDVAHVLRARGLRGDGHLRVTVPEPLGTIGEWHMTLQAWHPGAAATAALAAGTRTARRAAAARLGDVLVALHDASPATERTHDIDDELAILLRALGAVADELPLWRERLEAVERACRTLGERVPAPVPTGIHRDYYPDQVLLHGGDAALLDLDLYARGDPAVDVGNLVAHVVELALRTTGDAGGFDDAVTTFRERYEAGRPGVPDESVDAYTTLSLARHVAISRRIASRRRWSGPLLALVERRLGLRCGSTVAPPVATQRARDAARSAADR